MSELAITEDHSVVRTGDEQLVTMKIDDQLFGLPILSAQDIVETHSITQVPMAPSAVAGVMNLRGRIVTVINLRRILGQEDNYRSRMGVTVEHDGDLYTILVDAIGEVMSVANADLQPVPTTLDSELKSLCSGIYRLETGLLALLDIDRILDADTILQTPQIDFIARKRMLKAFEEEAAQKKTRASHKAEKTEDEPGEAEEANAGDAAQDDPMEPDLDDSLAPEGGQTIQDPLFERIGGPVAVEAAVDLFYEKVMGDESLVGFFEGVDMNRQRQMLKDFMSMALGGPNQYGGKALRAAHARLVNEQGLGNEHFDAVAGHLEATLRDLTVPDDIITEALTIVSGTRDDVLGG
jgi:chemotaxis signal transduction protein/truncated hemoglobin YjbI